MGVATRIPLPAPTESESNLTAEPDTADYESTITSALDDPGDEQSHYSLPDDGTPVTIKTRGHRPNKSQTSLLIEYFEGGKPGPDSPGGSGSRERRPSVRVRVTPSSKSRGLNDHIQITEMSSRKARDSGEPGDDRSLHSYASATEESNVSRNPIEVEIDPGVSRRRRKPSSPLIPTSDSKASYLPPNMSDISGIPTDSFLDGTGENRYSKDELDRTPQGNEARAVGALNAAASVLTDKSSNRGGRSETHERNVMQKAVEKASKPERKSKSKVRSSAGSEKEFGTGSPRRKSRSTPKDSLVSGAESSLMSSQLSAASHRTYDSHSSSKISINNPKLLETVEDAIRRLILPELDAIKRERSQRETRRPKDRDSFSSLTSAASKEEFSVASKRKSADTAHSIKSKASRGREARNDLSPQSSADDVSVEASDLYGASDLSSRRDVNSDVSKAAIGAAALGAAAALRSRSRGDDKRQRRRRRGESSKRDYTDDYGDDHEVVPPMPLQSEINPSEMTRTSIQTAESLRPHSASEEITPVQEVNRGVTAVEAPSRDAPTPSRTPAEPVQSVKTLHHNISHGDLKNLPRRGTMDRDEFEDEEYRQERARDQDGYYDDYDDQDHLKEPAMYDDEDEEDRLQQAFYGHQDVPAPLRYVPYQQERRGLSPIQSVSGFTDGGDSEYQGHRNSRLAPTGSDLSALSGPDRSAVYSPNSAISGPERSLVYSPNSALSGRDRSGVWSPNSIPSNMRSREFGDETSSVGGSGVGYNRQSAYTEDSELGRSDLGRSDIGRSDFGQSEVGRSDFGQSDVGRSDLGQSELGHPDAGQTVHQIGDNPQMVHQNSGIESVVASLVDGSQLDPSMLSGAGGNQEYRNSRFSYESPRQAGSPLKQSVDADQDFSRRSVSPISTAGGEQSNVSANYTEYDLDEYGRKVPQAQAQYRHSPTASESAITSAALRQAAAEAIKRKNGTTEDVDEHDQEFIGEGVARNRSFKDRAKGFNLGATPKHSADRLSDYDQPQMQASALPGLGEDMPEIGYGYESGQHSRQQTPSLVEGQPGNRYEQDRYEQDRESNWTPTQEATHYQQDRSLTPKASKSGPGFFGTTDAAAAATIATATALAAAHSRQPSQEQDDEWQRTSGDRKRDTLVTNPYEGASPIANLPGLDGVNTGGYGANAYSNFNTGSPGLPAGDEGYISAAPNEHRQVNNKGKGVDFVDQPATPGAAEDPFYSTPKNQRQMSGLSQGMGSPLYDAATGTGIDRIQSKDIIALMEHLMVRDAQRSARDTEMLVTLVRSAAEMRNSFEDIKRMLADTEDQIITEIKDNTEQTVKRHMGGPRPFPGSSGRSIQGGSQAGTAAEEVAKKKRSFLRRALQGLGNKGATDLGRIEDMLMQLLTDVDVLKHQTAGPADMSPPAQSMRSINQEVDDQYEDRGYEPEGHAGTSTGSFASQPAPLSIGKGSGRLNYDRRVSDHRISTVPEGNEDDYEDTYVTANNQYSSPQGLMSPTMQQPRSGSVPLGTPPQSSRGVQNSLSNDNTPRTEEGKKHKSRGSATFFPKISRWSETTTSSIGKVFRNSKSKQTDDVPEDFLQHPESRSGSVNEYDSYDQYNDSYSQDKLHSGFSEHDLSAGVGSSATPGMPHSFNQHGPPPASYATPEDPKYKAHRNSLNLQHPQPRQGQSFRATLETSAQGFDNLNQPMSPRSTDWAGSATSLGRFPEQNTNRYSDHSGLSGQTGEEYRWNQSPAPPRPPKEPLEGSPLAQVHSPVSNSRVGHMQRNSPMPFSSAVDSGYGTGSQTHAGSYHSGSPKPENKNLNSALGVPTRRPSGPRAMTPTNDSETERRRKRDTFGSIARPASAASQESETF